MPIVLALLALFVPRLTILVLWLLTSWFEGVFRTVLWPVLGFIFMPLTMLWYSAVQNWNKGQWDVLPIVGLVIAIVLDLAPSRLWRRRPAVA